MVYQPVIEAAGPTWRPPLIDAATGYRSLPIFAAQPQIRAEQKQTKSDTTGSLVEEMLDNGTIS